MSHELLKTQRNEIFNLIKDIGLNPIDFEWKASKSKIEGGRYLISVLFHKSTRYYYGFDVDAEGRHWFEYSPGKNVTTQPLSHTTSWTTVIDNVKYWLRRLKQEVEEPDLWAIMGQERQLVETTNRFDSDNSQFTKEEQGRIAGNLNEIKQYLLRIENLSQVQKELLEGQYAYLIDASTRLGKKDFLNILVGILLNQILTCGIVPEKAGELLRFAGQIFHWLAGGVISLPLHT
jgi:hypothetical protein